MALSDEEREIMISKVDADEEWSVFVDSRSDHAGRLVRAAKKLKREITKVETGGVEFTLPLWALQVATKPKAVTNPKGNPENIHGPK